MSRKKPVSRPGLTGLFICILLVASWGMGTFTDIKAMNSIIKVIAMCLSVHLIRSTAKQYGKHVWHVPALITLWIMPVFNLAITAVNLVGAGIRTIQSLPFSVVLVAFSIPLFFLYYFIYLVRKFCNLRSIKTVTIVLAVVNAFYAVMQLFDKAFLPALIKMDFNPSEKLIDFMAHSSEAALVVYVVAATGFCILHYNMVKSDITPKEILKCNEDEISDEQK